jgi:uncharacterized paraquat-inducible protein A
MAQCPLCKTTFSLPSVEEEAPLVMLPAVNVPDPSQPWRPAGQPEPTNQRDVDRPVPNPSGKIIDTAKDSLTAKARGAAGWLLAMVSVGLVQLLLCGTCQTIALLNQAHARVRGGGMLAELALVEVGLLFLRFFVLVIIWVGALNLRKRRSPKLIRLAANLAWILAGFLFLGILFFYVAVGFYPPGAMQIAVLSVPFSFFVAVFGCVGAYQAFALLGDRDFIREATLATPPTPDPED